jgi:hypothetical protein
MRKRRGYTIIRREEEEEEPSRKKWRGNEGNNGTKRKGRKGIGEKEEKEVMRRRCKGKAKVNRRRKIWRERETKRE